MIYDVTHEETFILKMPKNKHCSQVWKSQSLEFFVKACIKSQNLLYFTNSFNLWCQPDSGTTGTKDLISTHKSRLCEGHCVVV